MSLMGTTGTTEFWAKCKAWFARKLGASTTATTISIQLKNNAGDNLGDAATISAATSTAAGAMTADMYSKLDGIESQANKYTHPTATATSAAAKKVGNDALGHVVLGDSLTASDVGAAASTHAHGNITSGGDITATAPTVASGDKLIINDESESKITNGPSFGSDSTKYLRNDGSWEVPAGTYSHPTHTAHSTSAIYKFTNDSKGHVDAATAATASDIVSLLGTTAVNRATADSSGNTFGAAAAKAVDSSISAGSTSANLPTSAAVATFVAGQVTGATAFQGVADSNTDISGASYVKGWYWVVGVAGTYVGQTCEVGDMVFAIADKGSSYSASDFSVVQNNIVEMTTAEVDAICV